MKESINGSANNINVNQELFKKFQVKLHGDIQNKTIYESTSIT